MSQKSTGKEINGKLLTPENEIHRGPPCSRAEAWHEHAADDRPVE
jgi:hypothetical protein